MLLTVDLDKLGVARDDRLLDVGCGEGRHCFGALERGAHVVGLDLDLASLRAGHGPLRARARERGGFGAVLRGDAFRLPFRNDRFDRAICSEVMEHVHDYPAAIREPRARGAARRHARHHRADGHQRGPLPASRGRLLRVSGRSHPDLPTARSGRCDAVCRLQPTGLGFAHGFHTPYWVLRSAVGLPRSERNPLVQAYRLFLIRATTSGWLDRFEKRVLDFLCPKSLVLYAQRTAERAAGAA